MAIGKATVIRNGVEVPYDPSTMAGSDPTLKGSGWIQKDGGTFYYDAKTNTYYPLDNMKAIIAAKSPETVDHMVKSFGYNSASDFLAGATPIEQKVSEEKQTQLEIAANNPSVNSATNLSANPKLTAFDSNIPAYIQLGVVDPKTGINSYNTEREVANREALNPTGMDTLTEALKTVGGTVGASDLENTFRNLIKQNTADNGASYRDNVYNSYKTGAQADTQDQLDAQRALLASMGLGMSTIVSDYAQQGNNKLNTNLQKSFYDSNTAAQNWVKELMGQGITMENNIGQRGQTAAELQNAIGINKANLFTNAQNRLAGTNEKVAANDLLNFGLQEGQHGQDVENAKYFLTLPYATNAAGNASAANGVNASNTAYSGAMQAYANQQEGISKLLGGVLTNALGKK